MHWKRMVQLYHLEGSKRYSLRRMRRHKSCISSSSRLDFIITLEIRSSRESSQGYSHEGCHIHTYTAFVAKHASISQKGDVGALVLGTLWELGH